MRAWRALRFGSYREVLAIENVPPPEVRGDDVLVRIRTAGINFPDTLIIAGKYQMLPPLPFTPGLEAFGERDDDGERVMCWSGGTGAFAEFIAVPPEHLFRVPPAMSDTEAAAFLTSFQTAYLALSHRAGLKRDEVLLVHGGAGALGSAAIQLGKVLGATVIATAGTAEKLAICRRLGADAAIDHSGGDIAAAVRAVSARGADVIFDPIGGALLERSLRTAAPEGRILILGFTSGVIPSIAANRILLRNVSLVGFYWGDYWKHNPARIREAEAALAALYERGSIRPLVGKEFAFDRLPDALDATIDRANYGKNVLLVG